MTKLNLNLNRISIPKVNYSEALSNCARDLICEIGALSIIAPVSLSYTSLNSQSMTHTLCCRIVKKYGLIGRKVYENFSYSVLNPILVIAQILSELESCVYGQSDYMLDPDIRVVGISYGQHISLKHCTCIIYTNRFGDMIPTKIPTEDPNAEPKNAHFMPQNKFANYEEFEQREASKGPKILGKYMTKMKKEPKQIVMKIKSDEDKFVSKNDYKKFLIELNIMKVNQISYCINHIFHGNKEIDVQRLIFYLKRLKFTILNKKKLNGLLFKIKKYYENQNISINTISKIITKGESKINVHDFKEQLRKSMSFLNFEDVNYLTNAFSIEYGYVEEQDFRNVMFNIKEQLITRKLTSVGFNKLQHDDKMQYLPIVLNENQKAQITTINVISMNELISKSRSRPQSTLDSSKSKIKLIATSQIKNPKEYYYPKLETQVENSRKDINLQTNDCLEPTINNHSNLFTQESSKLNIMTLCSHNGSRASHSAFSLLSTENHPSQQLKTARVTLGNLSPKNSCKETRMNARLLGGWIYLCPGYNSEKIGKAEKYGTVKIVGQTPDGLWLKFSCKTIEGWIPTSKVDLTIDRKQYKIFDFSTISLHPRNYIKTKTLTIVHLRTYPKWTAPSINSLDILTEVIITKFTENKEWVEISCSALKKTISGWIPTYSIDASEFNKLICKGIEKSGSAKAIKENNFRIKVIKDNKIRKSASQESLPNQEKHARFEMKIFNRKKSESIQRLEEVKLWNNNKILNKILDNKHKRKALSILFKNNLYKCWKKWRQLLKLLYKSKANN